MNNLYLSTSLLLALFASALGCNSGGQLDVAPTECMVTLDGKPLPGVHVVLTPESGRIARGETNAEGLATLSTYGSGDGAIVGKHVAVVLGPNAPKLGAGFNPDLPITAPTVPPAYRSPATSGLNCEVKSGLKNLVRLDLTSRGPPSSH